MIASASPTAFRVLLGGFGVALILIMTVGVLRTRRDPRDVYTAPFLILMISYGLIGLTALGAAVSGSPILFVTMVGLTFAHVILRRIVSRRHGS
jgi:hypothetical protein